MAFMTQHVFDSLYKTWGTVPFVAFATRMLLVLDPRSGPNGVDNAIGLTLFLPHFDSFVDCMLTGCFAMDPPARKGQDFRNNRQTQAYHHFDVAVTHTSVNILSK